MEWEVVESDNLGRTERAWVPAGWLVKVISWADDSSGIALTFYPDPNGEWVV